MEMLQKARFYALKANDTLAAIEYYSLMTEPYRQLALYDSVVVIVDKAFLLFKKKYYTKDGEKNPTQFEGQKLYLMDGKYVLDLSCRYNVSGVTFYSDRFICFWGLYPKLSPKDIMVKIQYVD